MMTKNRSGAWAACKVLIMIPAIFLLVLFFAAGTATNSIAQQKKEEPQSPGNSKATVAPQQKETKSIGKEKQSAGEEVFTQVEEMPSFPGGDDARVKFMVENIKYPENAKKKGIQGKVFVQFIVEKDGTVSNAKVMRGFDADCDKEALRVIKMMPKWNPGKQKGQAVRVQFVLPIKFALDNHQGKKEEPKQ